MPELTPFGGAWQGKSGEEVRQMAVGCVVVRDVAGCRGGDLRDVLCVQPSAFRPGQWSVELAGEVLG